MKNHSDIDGFCSFFGWPKSEECADCEPRIIWEDGSIRMRRSLWSDIVLDIWDLEKSHWILGAVQPEDLRKMVGAWLKEKF